MLRSNTVPIDVSLVRRLVATQFPQWANLLIKPVEFGGWDNRTFHLGEHMSIRLPSASEYSLQVEKEHYCLPKLAPHLPLPIPIPLAMGHPAEGYPWNWSIYQWIEGITSITEVDFCQFASTLTKFLSALQKIDPTDGPLPGPHNFYRGGSLKTYDAETRKMIRILSDQIDVETSTALWNEALASPWQNPPVWVHGDIAVGNLLFKKGLLTAVIDFGGLSIGDPACDLVIAWTVFKGKSREIFHAGLSLDNATWARARGWALWKALIVCAGVSGTNPLDVEKSKKIIDEVLTDHTCNG